MRTIVHHRYLRETQRGYGLPLLLFAAMFCALSLVAAPAHAQTEVPGPTTGGATSAVISVPGVSCMAYDPVTGYPTAVPCDGADTIDKIAGERVRQMVQHGQLARLLLGSYEQINCTNTCISAFGAIGSFSAGFHGRKYITDRLSILGGLSINEYKSGSVSARQALIGAAALRYDLVDWGSSRPFFEVGGSVSPSERTKFSRSYTFGGTQFRSVGSGRSSSYMVYGRVGWVKRVTPRDEFAIFADLVRQWNINKRVTETGGAGNPFPAVYQPGTDMMNVARLAVQHTHLLNSKIELGLNVAVAQSFGTKSGVKALVGAFGLLKPSIGNKAWVEYGARIGFRLNKRVTIDTFVLGASGPKPIGTTVHGGVGVRAIF